MGFWGLWMFLEEWRGKTKRQRNQIALCGAQLAHARKVTENVFNGCCNRLKDNNFVAEGE